MRLEKPLEQVLAALVVFGARLLFRPAVAVSVMVTVVSVTVLVLYTRKFVVSPVRMLRTYLVECKVVTVRVVSVTVVTADA